MIKKMEYRNGHKRKKLNPQIKGERWKRERENLTSWSGDLMVWGHDRWMGRTWSRSSPTPPRGRSSDGPIVLPCAALTSTQSEINIIIWYQMLVNGVIILIEGGLCKYRADWIGQGPPLLPFYQTKCSWTKCLSNEPILLPSCISTHSNKST